MKKLKKYYLSDKSYYKIIGTHMHVAGSPKKPFKPKYDLTNYNVRLSKGDKDKFYLEPIDENLKLNMIKFVCEDADQRANWYKAILKITQANPNSDKFASLAGNQSADK